jgi:hypothetical protein
MSETKLNPIGALKDPADPRDILFASLVPPGVAISLPRKFSLRTDQSPVFLQKYGSCVGGSARSALEYYIWKLTGVRKTLSDRFLYGRSKEYDQTAGEGTWPRVMLKVMFALGAPLFERWPNEPSPTHDEFIKQPPLDVREEAIENVLEGGFARVLNYEELKRAIYLFGPALITLPVYGTYDAVGTNGKVQPSNGAGFRGNHENIAVGWDDDANGGVGEIEVKNQWDKTWGDQGYGFIPLNYAPGSFLPLTDMWSINNMVNAQETTGAPINLGYPVETDTPFITQVFGARPEYYAKYGMKGHNGLDFRTKDLKNKFITACDDGEVILSAVDGGYGLAVRIKHTWGMSVYGHNSKLLVSDTGGDGGMPQKVVRGQRIAVPGCTGDCEGEHCHFSIRINGVKNPGFFDWVDPTPYFGKVPMTKYFKIDQLGKLGILVLEGFAGTGLFENDFAEYQELLKITNIPPGAKTIVIPDGKFFRIQDGSKLGIMVVDGFACTILFENDYAEYKTLLKISGLTEQDPIIQIPQ